MKSSSRIRQRMRYVWRITATSCAVTCWVIATSRARWTMTMATSTPTSRYGAKVPNSSGNSSSSSNNNNSSINSSNISSAAFWWCHATRMASQGCILQTNPALSLAVARWRICSVTAAAMTNTTDAIRNRQGRITARSPDRITRAPAKRTKTRTTRKRTRTTRRTWWKRRFPPSLGSSDGGDYTWGNSSPIASRKSSRSWRPNAKWVAMK